MSDIDMVIKIPEEIYEIAKQDKWKWPADDVYNAIKNGKPISKELDALQGDIQDEVLKWHRTLYLTGRVDAADAVAFALQLVNEQFAARQEQEVEK